MKAAGIDIELVRRADRIGFKAGALEEGMKTCKSEFILILGRRFCAGSRSFKENDPFFHRPEDWHGPVALGHINRTYSLLTRVQAMFLDGHLLLEQTARSRSGRFLTSTAPPGSGASRALKIRRLAARHADGDLDLSTGAARRLKFIFCRPSHAGEAAGRYERL